MAEFKDTYILPDPYDERYVGRVEEVLFYLLARSFISELENRGKGLNYMDQFFGMAAKSFEPTVKQGEEGLNESTVIYTFNLIRASQNRPTLKEICVVLRMFGVSYREINESLGIHRNTIAKYVKQFYDEGAPPMMARLIGTVRYDMSKATVILKDLFLPAARVSSMLQKYVYNKKRD